MNSKKIYSIILLSALLGSTLYGAQLPITVGTDVTPASLDTNFGNIDSNFNEIFGWFDTENTWTATQTFTGGIAASEFRSTCAGTGDCYSLINNNTSDVPIATFAGKAGIYAYGDVLYKVENGVKSVLSTSDSYPTGGSAAQATGNVNIDGLSADHYYYQNGATAATYTPVITAAQRY